uniref:hypothetical protein n=1 Tax=Flavobacterium sp. TaxID=239 RepID=UPI00404A1C5C
MKTFTMILLSIILFSCNYKSNEKKNSIVLETRTIAKEDSKLKVGIDTVSVDTGKKILPLPKFEEFKHYCETFGGSFLQKTYLFKPKQNGYFGTHHLYDKQKNVQMGFLIAHNAIDKFYDWKLSDTTQVYIALIMKRSGSRLKLFNEIGISDKKEKLVDFFGKPQIENDTMIVYWDNNRTIGQFKIDNGRIVAFIYGRYNDSINLPLTQNELNKINVW